MIEFLNIKSNYKHTRDSNILLLRLVYLQILTFSRDSSSTPDVANYLRDHVMEILNFKCTTWMNWIEIYIFKKKMYV